MREEEQNETALTHIFSALSVIPDNIDESNITLSIPEPGVSRAFFFKKENER